MLSNKQVMMDTPLSNGINTLGQFSKRAFRHMSRRCLYIYSKWDLTQSRIITSFRIGYYNSSTFSKYRLPSMTLSSLGVAEISDEPIIMDDICMPPYYSFDASNHGEHHWSSDHDDIRTLMAMVSARQPKIVLELGTAHGNTTANICQHSAESTIYTVNAPAEEQTGESTTFDLTRDDIGCVYKKYNYTERVVQIYKNTLHLDLSEYFDGPIISLAIVDACHDEEYVINDFLKVEQYVAPGGMILLHDTHPSMKHHLIGSYVGCMKLRARGYDIRHLENTWWGVWVKGDTAELT